MKFRPKREKINVEVGKTYYVDFRDKYWSSRTFYRGRVKVVGTYNYFRFAGGPNYKKCFYVQRLASPPFEGEWLPIECFIKEVYEDEISG